MFIWHLRVGNNKKCKYEVKDPKKMKRMLEKVFMPIVYCTYLVIISWTFSSYVCVFQHCCMLYLQSPKKFLFAPALRHWQVVRCSSLIHPCIGQIQGIIWPLGKYFFEMDTKFEKIFHFYFDVRSGGGAGNFVAFSESILM